jgi:hypothetical protein
MNTHRKLAAISAIAAAAISLGVGSAAAATPRHDIDLHFGGGGAVFVQSDNATANTVVAYSRAADGVLTQQGVYPTDGQGGALTGRRRPRLPGFACV